MSINPSLIFADKPVKSDRSIGMEDFLVYYRQDLPGELEIPEGLTHHLITFFLTDNQRQVTHLDRHGEYDGPMKQGEFYLYPAAVSGFTSWAAADETLHLFIKPDLLRSVAIETESLNPDKIELLPVLKTYDPQIEQLTKLLFWEMQNNSLGGKLYLESLKQVLVIHLLRNYSVFEPVFRKYNNGLPPYKLRQTIEYIQAYLDRDLSLKVMAEQIGMSRSYFAVRFKQAMGIPPHQYVNQQRIEKAKQLLKERSLTIAEIALECGFASQSHLNKVFRKYVGTTPKNYREKL
jgi:AraC family transcriptional regulator